MCGDDVQPTDDPRPTATLLPALDEGLSILRRWLARVALLGVILLVFAGCRRERTNTGLSRSESAPDSTPAAAAAHSLYTAQGIAKALTAIRERVGDSGSALAIEVL